MAHSLMPFKKPVLRVFALFLSCSLLLPSPAHALRVAQPETAQQRGGLEEQIKAEGTPPRPTGPVYPAYRILYTNTGAAPQNIPPSLRGNAVYSGFSFFDTAKSSQAPGALVLLIDFQRFVKGHFKGNRHQQDRNYVQRMTQRFFFGNAQAIQAIVFYNAPEQVTEAIGGLWSSYQFDESFKSEENWLVQKPLWAIPGPIRAPDQLTVPFKVEVADLNTAAVSFGSSSAGLEEPLTSSPAEIIRQLGDLHEAVRGRIKQERPDLWDEKFGRYIYNITAPEETAETIRKLREHGYLRNVKRAADLGSGQGAVVQALVALTPQERIHVTGFEIDPMLLAAAHVLTGLVDPARIQWRQQSYLAGDVDLREFDLLFMNPSIEGVLVGTGAAAGIVPLDVLQRVIQKMKPGALIVFSGEPIALRAVLARAGNTEYLPEVNAFRRTGPPLEEVLERHLESAWPKIEGYEKEKDYRGVIEELQGLPEIPPAYRTAKIEQFLRLILPVQARSVEFLGRRFMVSDAGVPEQTRDQWVMVAAQMAAPLLVHRDLLAPGSWDEKSTMAILLTGTMVMASEGKISRGVAEKYLLDPALGLPTRGVGLTMSSAASWELDRAADQLRDRQEFSLRHSSVEWPMVKTLAYYVIALSSQTTQVLDPDYERNFLASFIGFVGAYYGIGNHATPMSPMEMSYAAPLERAVKELRLGPVPTELIQAVYREDKAALFNLGAIGAEVLARVADQTKDTTQLHQWADHYANEARLLQHHRFFRSDLFPMTNPPRLGSGLEEPGQGQGPRFNRRTLFKAAGAAAATAGLGTWWFTRQPEERFLPPEEVPEPWKQLFEPKKDVKPLPFLGEDYFRFQISSRHQAAAYRAFDRDGKELGNTDATRGEYQRIADPRTGETLGYYAMPVQWGLKLDVERFVLKDSTDGEMMTVSVYPYVQKGAVITKGIPLTAVEGVPGAWRDPDRLKTESARPIYRVFEDEKHQVSRVEMIGYVETDAEKPGRLLDVDKRPIARLEPVQIIYFGQDPKTFQQLNPALASRPGNNRYFTEAPSEKLAVELSDALDRFRPATPAGKKAKLQLAHRWVQLQVLLGKRTIAVDSKKARETGEALVKRSVAELEDFKNPEVRRLLWDAIANFHPWFAMAREAARHLGWEEDPEILQYVLSQIQQWWIQLENSKQNALSNGDGRMTDLTKDVLEEVLLYNGFQTLDEVADGFRLFLGGPARFSREFLYIDRPKGSDPALVPLSLMQARLKGFRDVSDVQILLQQAVALQRLGYEVSFLSYIPVANGLEKEEPVKTLSHEWVVMATHPDHPKEAVLFSTHREFLKRFGEEISPGVTRVTRERILEVNQSLPQGFYLAMEKYSPFPLNAAVYLQARDQAMRRRTSSFPPWHAELMGPGLGLAVELEGELHQQFEQDLASVYVQTMAQRFDEIVKEMGIEVVTSGLIGSELEVRKAGYGAALGLIPRKLITDLEKIVFLRETKIVPSREARVENGRVIWENVDLEAEGTYSGRTIKSMKGVSTPIHEIVHHWDLHVTDQVHDWRGDLSELFHQISWQLNGRGSWALRKTTEVDMRDFAQRTHGLANEKEDIAVNGSQYVMDGVAFRADAREAMGGGNYAPAVKYLFAKYLLFLDTDGTSFEYSVGPGSPALTWDEVAAVIRSDAEGLNPKPESKRLGALVERMREVWQKERESKSIVQRAAEAPLLAAAGVEENERKTERPFSPSQRYDRNEAAVQPWHDASIEMLDLLITHGGEEKTPNSPNTPGSVFRFENKKQSGRLTHESTLSQMKDWIKGDSRRGFGVQFVPQSSFTLYPIQLKPLGGPESRLASIPGKLERLRGFLREIREDNPFQWAAGMEEPNKKTQALEQAVARAEKAVDQGEWRELEKAAFALVPLQGQAVPGELGGPEGEVWDRLNGLVRLLQELKAADAFEDREDPRIQRWQVEAVALLFSADRLYVETVDAILPDLSVSGEYLWATLYQHWGIRSPSRELVPLMDAMVVLFNVSPREQGSHWKEVEESKTSARNGLLSFLASAEAISRDDLDKRVVEMGWVYFQALWNEKTAPVPNDLRRDFLLRNPETIENLSVLYQRFIGLMAGTMGFSRTAQVQQEISERRWSLLQSRSSSPLWEPPLDDSTFREHMAQMEQGIVEGDWDLMSRKAGRLKVLSAGLVQRGAQENREDFQRLEEILSRIQTGKRPTNPDQLHAVRLWEANALALLAAVSTPEDRLFQSKTVEHFLEDPGSLEGEFWELLYSFSRFMSPPEGLFADSFDLTAIEFLVWSTLTERFDVSLEQLPPSARAQGIQSLADSIRSVPGELASSPQRSISPEIQQQLLKAFSALSKEMGPPSLVLRHQFLLGSDETEVTLHLQLFRAQFLSKLADRIGWFSEGEKWAEWDPRSDSSAGVEEGTERKISATAVAARVRAVRNGFDWRTQFLYRTEDNHLGTHLDFRRVRSADPDKAQRTLEVLENRAADYLNGDFRLEKLPRLHRILISFGGTYNVRLQVPAPDRGVLANFIARWWDPKAQAISALKRDPLKQKFRKATQGDEARQVLSGAQRFYQLVQRASQNGRKTTGDRMGWLLTQKPASRRFVLSDEALDRALDEIEQMIKTQYPNLLEKRLRDSASSAVARTSPNGDSLKKVIDQDALVQQWHKLSVDILKELIRYGGKDYLVYPKGLLKLFDKTEGGQLGNQANLKEILAWVSKDGNRGINFKELYPYVYLYPKDFSRYGDRLDPNRGDLNGQMLKQRELLDAIKKEKEKFFARLTGLEEDFVSQDARTSERLRTEFLAGRLTAAEFVDEVLRPFHTAPMPPPGLAADGYRPLGVPVDEGWVPMLWEMSKGEIVRATETESVRKKASEAVKVFLSRVDGDAVPGQPMRGMSDNVAVEMMLEIMRVATGTMDPYAALKREYNEKALAYLDPMWRAVTESPDPVRTAIALGIIGNAIDFASVEQRERLEREGFSVGREIERARGLSFVRDERADLLAALERNPAGEILFLVDNAGEIVLDLPLIRIFLEQGRPVTVVGKSLPHANDMTAEELRQLFADERVRNFLGADRIKSLQVIASGTAMTGLDLRRATPEMAEAWRRAPIIYAKGQGMVETLRYFPLFREVFHAVMVKGHPYFHETGPDGAKLPLKNGDVLFLHTPATGLEEGTEELERYRTILRDSAVSGSIREALAEVGAIRPGSHWGIARFLGDLSQIDLDVELNYPHPSEFENVPSPLGISNPGMMKVRDSVLWVRFNVQKGKPARLVTDVEVSVQGAAGSVEWILLPEFLRQMGLRLDQVRSDLDPFTTLPSGTVFRQPDTGEYVVSRTDHLVFLVVNRKREPIGVGVEPEPIRLPPEGIGRILLHYHINSAPPMVPSLSPEDLARRVTYYAESGSQGGIPPAHLALDAQGHARIYIPKANANWGKLAQELPELSQWYQARLAGSSGEEMWTALSEWEQKLSPYFIITRIEDFERPTAGLEEPKGPDLSRRSFLKVGGGAGALLTEQEKTDVPLPTVPPDVFGRIAKLVRLYEEGTRQGGWFQKPEELIQDRAAVTKGIESLGEDHPLRRQLAEAEKAFRGELNRFRTADAGTALGLPLRAEGLRVALDRPEQYPLWAMTRTLTWLLREEFQVKGLDPDRELQRAVRAGMSSEQYLADLAARYVEPDNRFREMTRFLQERGLPAKLYNLQQISQDQLESAHAQLMSNGMQLTTEGLGFHQPTIFLRREQRARIEHVWQEKSHSLFERLKARFGPDLHYAEHQMWPDPSNDVTLEQVLREKEERSVSASLAARKSRLSERVGNLLQKRPRESISEEVIHQEEAKIRGLSDEMLEKLDFDRYLTEVEQRHPEPPAPDFEEQIRRAVAVKRLPAPADPVLELAKKLADSAREEPAVLFIQKGLDNVSVRWRAGAQGEWNRLTEWERDSLRNSGWLSLVQHKRYVVGIDPGISVKEMHQHLRRGGFLWQRAPDEDGVVRWDIQRQRVIALPGPAEPAAGGSAPLTTGLEESVEAIIARAETRLYNLLREKLPIKREEAVALLRAQNLNAAAVQKRMGRRLQQRGSPTAQQIAAWVGTIRLEMVSQIIRYLESRLFGLGTVQESVYAGITQRAAVQYPDMPYVAMEELPAAVNRLFEALDLQPGQRLLEVGPGSDGGIALIALLRGLRVTVVEPEEPFKVDLPKLISELRGTRNPQLIQLQAMVDAGQTVYEIHSLQLFQKEVAQLHGWFPEGNLTVIRGDFSDPGTQARVLAAGPFDHAIATDVMNPSGQDPNASSVTTTSEPHRIESILQGLARASQGARNLYVSFIVPEEGQHRQEVARTLARLEGSLQRKGLSPSDYVRVPHPSSGGVLSGRLYRFSAGLEEPTAGPTDDEIQQWVQGVKSGTADEDKSTSVLLGWLDLPDSEPVPVSLLVHEPVDPEQPWFNRFRFLSEATEGLDRRIARSERAHQVTRRVLEEALRQRLDLSRGPIAFALVARLQTDLFSLTQHTRVVSSAVSDLGQVLISDTVAQELLASRRPDAMARSRIEEEVDQVRGMAQRATEVLHRAEDVKSSLRALLDRAGVREGPNWVNLAEFLSSDGSSPSAGLEEGRGFVLVEGVGMLAPPDLPAGRYYVVAIGIEQAAALIQAGRAPGRIIAVATVLGEVAGLAALGIPGDQIVQARDWPTLEAAKNYAVRLGREWLNGLGGLQVSVLEVTATTLQGILAQLQELLPSAWQTARPITAEDAQRALELSV